MNKLFSDLNLPEVEWVYFTDNWVIKSKKTDEVRYNAKSFEDAKNWCFSNGAWLVKKENERYTSLIEIK